MNAKDVLQEVKTRLAQIRDERARLDEEEATLQRMVEAAAEPLRVQVVVQREGDLACGTSFVAAAAAHRHEPTTGDRIVCADGFLGLSQGADAAL